MRCTVSILLFLSMDGADLKALGTLRLVLHNSNLPVSTTDKTATAPFQCELVDLNAHMNTQRNAGGSEYMQGINAGKGHEQLEGLGNTVTETVTVSNTPRVLVRLTVPDGCDGTETCHHCNGQRVDSNAALGLD
jgi:hypothetical protein